MMRPINVSERNRSIWKFCIVYFFTVALTMDALILMFDTIPRAQKRQDHLTNEKMHAFESALLATDKMISVNEKSYSGNESGLVVVYENMMQLERQYPEAFLREIVKSYYGRFDDFVASTRADTAYLKLTRQRNLLKREQETLLKKRAQITAERAKAAQAAAGQ